MRVSLIFDCYLKLTLTVKSYNAQTNDQTIEQNDSI